MNPAYADAKVAWHTDKIKSLRETGQCVPGQVQLVISDLCNHDCPWCLTGTAFVDTISGRRNVSSIKVGDRVWGPDGNVHEVTEVGARTATEVYRVRIGDTCVEASGEHPFLTEDGWKEARYLRVGDSAVVRVRLRDDGREIQRDLEFLRQGPSAKRSERPSGALRKSACSHEDRQPHEKAGGRGEGIGGDQGASCDTVHRGESEYFCGCSDSDALRPQSNEATRGTPGRNGEGPVPPDVKDRAALSGMGIEFGYVAVFDRPGRSLDRSSEPRLPRSRSEEMLGANAEGVLCGLREASRLDELRSAYDCSLPKEEVGVLGGVRQGQDAIFGSPGSDDKRIHVAGIPLERGLELRPIDSILKIHGPTTVYSLTCEPGHAFEANGVVVHNCAYRAEGYASNQHFSGPGGERNPNRKIPTEKCLEIIDDIAALGVRAIQFTGGGEPTVHKDHIAIFRHALDKGLKCALVTNGNTLAAGWEAVYPFFDWIRVSLDAGTSGTYSRLRRVKPERFDLALTNILAMTDAGCSIGTSFIVQRENFGEAAAAADRARSAGAKSIRFAALFSPELARYYDGWGDKAQAAVSEAVRMYDGPEFKVIDMLGQRRGDLSQGHPDASFCGYQHLNVYIGGDQRVYRCCNTAYNDLGFVGSLENQTFSEFWASEAKAAAYRDFDARACEHCAFNGKNELLRYLVDKAPLHVDFV